MKKITFIKCLLLLFIFFFSCNLVFSQNMSLNFDGTTSPQYVETANMIPLTDSFTVMGWIYVNAGHTQIFSWGSPTVNKYIQIKSSFDYKFEVYVPSGVLSFKSTSSILGAWHHVAVTNDSGNFKIYVDGTNEANTTADLSSITPTQTSLGSALFNGIYQGTGNYDIDEISIWDIALTESEVQTYKSTPPMGSESGLVAAYNFNTQGATPSGDNTGLTALTDLAGNYPATLFGFPLTGSTGNYVTTTNTTLTTSKFENQIDIFLYPNPTKDNINFKPEIGITVYGAEIYNCLGNLIKSFEVSEGQVNIADLSKGIYILNITSNKGNSIHKIVKE